MLKIKDDVDLKKLEKFGIFPEYECDIRTGQTRVKCCSTTRLKFERLLFKKVKKNIIKRVFSYTKYDFILALTDEIDLDKLYDLIQADLVEKVGE